MDPNADRPGVIVLPPLLFLGALVLGTVLQRVWPLVLPVPVPVRWLAVLGFLGFTTLVFVARGTFLRAGTHVNPMLPAVKLVESGPFRWTRNPMYVGMVGEFLSIAVLLGWGWLLVVLLPAVVVLHRGVVLREERYLRLKFGGAYDDYARRVRRYV